MAASTQQVLDHHLQAFGTGDLDAILEDYADGSIIIGPDGVLRTRKEWSDFFSTLFAEFAKPGMSSAWTSKWLTVKSPSLGGPQ